jgi:hypothetical protein
MGPAVRSAKGYEDIPGVVEMLEVINDSTQPDVAVFRRLRQLAIDGDLADEKTLMALLKQVADSKERQQDKTGRKMKGIRYNEDAMNLWIIVRSRGLSATGPYSALKSILGGPSASTLQ